MPEPTLANILPITGYIDKVSGRPGDTLAVKVSSAKNEGVYVADVIKIKSGDPNPDGPGLIYLPQDFGLAPNFPAKRQDIDIGSYASIPSDEILTGSSMLFGVLIQPWLLTDKPSSIACALDVNANGWILDVNNEMINFTHRSDEGSTHCVQLAISLKLRQWYHIWAGYDVNEGRLVIGCANFPDGESIVVSKTAPNLAPLPSPSALILAARKTGPISEAHFNGCLEDPAIYAKLPEAKSAPSLPDVARSGTILAWWDLSIGIDTQSIVDRGPRGLSGRLVNIPSRAVVGSKWKNEVMHWCQAPREYAAIHFHDDDLYDCGWETDFEIVIPQRTPSGVYGVRLCQDGDQDILPFYVLPPRAGSKNEVCFLASTFTHQAYANHARGNCDDEMQARIKDWGATPYNPQNYPIYGLSTYNFHSDGTGSAISSRLRPTLTIRPGYITFTDKSGSGLRHFSADTHILNWLEDRGIPFDVVTDEDLDDEGSDLIKDYKTLLTGSHPEYHTIGTIDSLQHYADTGGKLVYLGGNGFYWKVVRSPSLPGVIELRRAEGGVRFWASKPGESYHQLDGSYGGLWRRHGRPPQKLVGVGFSAQGLFEGSYYRRMPDSYNPGVQWIFDGVEEEKLGNYGLSGGGAAGFELDRADSELGSPEGITILARSEGHDSSVFYVPYEEMLTNVSTETKEDPKDLIRSEIIFCVKPNGGCLFSVGSICFCGSLNHNGGTNGISRMLENVIRRFAEL